MRWTVSNPPGLPLAEGFQRSQAGVASCKCLPLSPQDGRGGNSGLSAASLLLALLQNPGDGHPQEGSVGSQSIRVNALGSMISIRDNNVLSEWDGILDYENVRWGTPSSHMPKKALPASRFRPCACPGVAGWGVGRGPCVHGPSLGVGS